LDFYIFLLLVPVVLVFLGLNIAAVLRPAVLGPVLALLAGWAELLRSFR
jgi:hypothetical protein